jgi:periplasmic copper chaperone A
MNRRSCAAWCAVALLTACAAPEPVTVANAWIRAPAPGTHIAAGYFDITNNTPTSVALIGAASDACASIEMHTTEYDGSTMRMRRLDRVELAAGATESFAPGGRHLMLLEFADVTSPTIAVTLQFADGAQLRVPFELRSVTGSNPS